MNQFIYSIALILSCNSVLFSQVESDFFTPPINSGITKDLVIDYNANNADTVDDSEVLQQAIDDLTALPNGGKISVPTGTYYFANVELKSNVHLEFQEEVTIFPAVALKNYAIFSIDGDNEIYHNVKISTSTGYTTVDFREVENKNVKLISVGNVENFSISDFEVFDNITKFAVFTGGASELNGGWNSAENGIVKNLILHNGEYGYGVVQMQAGRNVFYKNLWGDGGVTLRFETGYNKMNERQVGGVFGMYGKNIYCQNGNAAVMISPHAIKNGHVEVDSITAINCGFAVRIGAGYAQSYQDEMGITPGYFANTTKVSNIHATYGETAHVKSKHFKYMPCKVRNLISAEKNADGISYTAPAIAPVINGALGNGAGYYTVTVANVQGEGFEYLNNNILYEIDAQKECTATTMSEEKKKIIEVSPNPSHNQFNIKTYTNGAASYRIYTIAGALVKEGNIRNNSIITGNNLAAGNYLLKINSTSQSRSQLLIKR